jgi:hypothetical protein
MTVSVENLSPGHRRTMAKLLYEQRKKEQEAAEKARESSPKRR